MCFYCNIYEIKPGSLRYLEHFRDNREKKSGIFGNIFRRFFVVFVSRPKLQGLLSFTAPPPEHPGEPAHRLRLNCRVCVFLKGAVSFPPWYPFDQKDLCFDVLLCDVNFSRFSSQVFFFAFLLKHGNKIPKMKLFL